MRILLTGSSGRLGQTLAPRLERDGHQVIGLDPAPVPEPTALSLATVATIACFVLVRRRRSEPPSKTRKEAP